MADPDRGWEQYGRLLARRMGVGWEEYWPFLGCMVDITKPEGLAKLNHHLSTCEFVDGDDPSPAGVCPAPVTSGALQLGMRSACDFFFLTPAAMMHPSDVDVVVAMEHWPVLEAAATAETRFPAVWRWLKSMAAVLQTDESGAGGAVPTTPEHPVRRLGSLGSPAVSAAATTAAPTSSSAAPLSPTAAVAARAKAQLSPRKRLLRAQHYGSPQRERPASPLSSYSPARAQPLLPGPTDSASPIKNLFALPPTTPERVSRLAGGQAQGPAGSPQQPQPQLVPTSPLRATPLHFGRTQASPAAGASARPSLGSPAAQDNAGSLVWD